MSKLEHDLLVMKALILYLKMIRKYAYANGRVEEGYSTHFMEYFAKRVAGAMEAHLESLRFYGVELEE